MDHSETFEILQISGTRDETEIRAAYHRLLAGVNPEDDPEGFKRLRKAYEEALAYAAAPAEERRHAGVEWLQDQEVGAFLQRAADIYDTFRKRLDPAEWKRLLSDPVLLSLEDGETAKWRLFSYLAEHYRLPFGIWKLLDEKFFIQEDQKEFREHLPEAFVDYLVRKLQSEEEHGSFPYEKLAGKPDADYDGFLQEYMVFSNERFDKIREALEEKGRRLEKLASYGISHPWYELDCAGYLLDCGRPEPAAALAGKLVDENPEDGHVRLIGAGILMQCGEKDRAAKIWSEYLTWENQTRDGRFHALSALAKLEAESGRWERAKDLCEVAGAIHDTETLRTLLLEILRNLIEKYRSKDGLLTEEEADTLCWSFIRTGSYEDGIAFFEAHPEYVRNTADWHRKRSILYVSAGRCKEALDAVGAWRQCMEQEEAQADPEDAEEAQKERKWYQAQNAHIEGRIWNWMYHQEKEKGDADPEALCRIAERALACHDRALALEPEQKKYLLHKLTLLRDIREDRKVIDVCEQMIRLDSSFFWAYSYMQEAYENLRMAQEVVDTFYRAKKIYAGNSEIYLRAVRVFLAYRQYQDALGILRQAEEAGAMNPELQVKKAAAICRLADRRDPEAWKEADAYAALAVSQLEKENADPALLAELYLERAWLNENTGAFQGDYRERMLQYARKSLKLQDNTNVRYFLGRLYLNEYKDYDQAYEHLKVCEAQGMDFTWMYLYLGRCQEYFKEYDRALSYYDRVMKMDPDFRDALWRMGWIWRNKFKRTTRTEYAEKALYYFDLQEERFGAFTDLFRWRSYLYLCLRDYGRALSEAEQGLAREEDSGLWLLKGRALRKLDRYEEALQSFEASILAKDRFGSDDKFCYGRIFQCFLAQKQYAEGIEYFKKVLKSAGTEELRELCLEYLSDYASIAGDYAQAFHWIEQWYGSLDLSDRGDDSWKRTADRIRDVLNVWLMHQDALDEAFYRKCRDAVSLAQKALADPEAEPEDQAAVCHSVGSACLYAGDRDLAHRYLTQAYSLLKDPESYDDYRGLLEYLMVCSYWQKDRKRAEEYGDQYRKLLEKDCEECGDLGRSMEELLAGPGPDSRLRLYRLASWAFYTGRYEEARRYAGLMCREKNCWWCHEEGCTEEWEIRGLLAMQEQKQAEAREAFERANRVSWLKGTKMAHWMLRVLNGK